MKYVYVIYDPLLEKVLCVHEKYGMECKKCNKSKYEERDSYHLEQHKRKVKTDE